MARVLITGADGFTGRYIVPRLLERGDEVHGLLRPGVGSSGVCELAHSHEADLTDLSALAAVVERVRPDAVIHLAGIAFVGHGSPRDIYDANLIGSRNLLQAIVDAGARPSAVLMASSANIYGNQRGGALNEDTSPQPVNDYGISKLAMELVAKLFMDKLPIVITRPFNYTGVGQSTDFLIPKIVDHSRRRTDRIELGNLDVERDFSDVRGVAEIYLRLMDEPRAAGGIFNVCSGRAYSLRSVINMVEQITGHKMRVETNPAFVRHNEVQSLFGDSSRLEGLIGRVEMPPLQTTLRWMIEA
jgi:nucleoside-diphosphate-sugar epimerase